MIETTMFYFFVLLAIGLLCLGIKIKPGAPFIFLSAVMFIVIGTPLVSQDEYLREYNGAIITEISGTVDHIDNNYVNHLATLDNVYGRNIMLWAFSYLFMLGGFLLLLYAIRDWWINRKSGGFESEEEEA